MQQSSSEQARFLRPRELSGVEALHATFVEHRYAHDPTNWWIPNRACAEAMLRSAGFEIAAHPEPEVYICKRRPARG